MRDERESQRREMRDRGERESEMRDRDERWETEKRESNKILLLFYNTCYSAILNIELHCSSIAKKFAILLFSILQCRWFWGLKFLMLLPSITFSQYIIGGRLLLVLIWIYCRFFSLSITTVWKYYRYNIFLNFITKNIAKVI